MKTNSGRFVFDSPAVYQIVIEGRVSTGWAETLGNMTVCAKQARGKSPTTILCGVVVDQAALMGLLTELYDMHCTLMEVKRMPDPEASEPMAPPLAQA